MARDYVAVYQALLQDKRPRPVPRLRVERPA
jgi:hypothetical protein